MRAALAIIVAILPLSPGQGPGVAQTHVGDVQAFESIHMMDALTGWAVTAQLGAKVLLRTTDGGTRWTDLTPLNSSKQEISVFQITAVSPLIAWVIPTGTIGGTTVTIFHTIDGGRTWRNATILAPSVEAIHFVNPRNGWLVASLVAYMGNDEVEIYRSTDGGETWVKVASATHESKNSGLSVDGAKGAITFLNLTTGWITGVTPGPDWLYLYITHNGGRTWRAQNLPLPPELTPHWFAFPQPPTFFTAQDSILPTFYSLLNDSRQETGSLVVFYDTHDGGMTWTQTAPVSVSHVNGFSATSFVDMNHGWVKEGNMLYVTSDGGRRWTTIHPDQPFAGVTQLDFISPQVGWAVRQTSPFLLKTSDGGHTWVPVTYTVLRL